MSSLINSWDDFLRTAISKRNDGSHATAARMFRYAANEGNPYGLFALGESYLHGYGVEKNEELGCELLARAADQGIDAASFELARFLYENRDYDQALPYLTRCADHSPKAAFMLGWMYFAGLATEKCEAKAVEYFERAACGGFDAAQYNLGYCYVNGLGVEEDLKRGVSWLKKAAYQQYPKALYALQEIHSKSPDLAEISDSEIGAMLLAQRIPDRHLAKDLDFNSFLDAIEESTSESQSEWLRAAVLHWRRRRGSTS